METIALVSEEEKNLICWVEDLWPWPLCHILNVDKLVKQNIHASLNLKKKKIIILVMLGFLVKNWIS